MDPSRYRNKRQADRKFGHKPATWPVSRNRESGQTESGCGLTNANIAELLAREAEVSLPPRLSLAGRGVFLALSRPCSRRIGRYRYELDKAVEVDAYPDRQDLSPDLLAVARKAGCRISFGTDAHGPGQLRFMAFAAASALRARSDASTS
jgi:hypothetical protein